MPSNSKISQFINTLRGGISSKAVYIASIISRIDFPSLHLIIAKNKKEALFLTSDLDNFFKEDSLFFLPTSFTNSSRESVKDATAKVQRTAALSAISKFESINKIDDYDLDNYFDWGSTVIGSQLIDTKFNCRNKPVLIVGYKESVEEKVLKQKSRSKCIISIRKGERVSHDFLKEVLFDNGFNKVDFVDKPGQFALRGSIIDIFSYSDNYPYRVDFFGSQIETISRFNSDTQRSIDQVEEVNIYPNIFENHDVDEYEDFLETIPSYCKIWDLSHEDVNVDILNTIPQPVFNKNFDILYHDILNRENEGYKIFILSVNQNQNFRLQHILRELGGNVSPSFIPISIHEGYIDNVEKHCYYTDHQIFERYHKIKIKREVSASERLTVNELSSFKEGDYIVHIDYGIGQFGGLVKINNNGKVHEAVKLIYKDSDVVYVSIHGIHRISRYKSADGEPPKVYKLGSKAWTNLKQNTKKKVKDMATDLIKLYSERMNSRGYAFSPDSYLQQELESSFIYEDTIDQHRATEDIKHDMEDIHPMDRLVCGDVGFGKTEVAIRAAFKAVCDSKQVVVLVPTTILALQHYQTFSARLKDFPCRIEYISRLKNPQEIKQIYDDLKVGKIDIIIGTHRILNKNVSFKDLGLLIIDEEQKFGVAAKEKLRQLKANVDTLTLTATPIPRTLQFSLLGARDLSIINTPPPNRLPVHTEIIDFNNDAINDIVDSEIERGGQIFFIHNKIEELFSIEDILRRVCPKARICVAHGKMEASELEKKVMNFIEGDYDILLSTTIIENGIDIPNANTIIINQAQNFGLSDLHQLRGRVGRSNVKAYCYLIVPPMKTLTEDARRRLNAIETFSDLGSGFNIAMQDLDIRGAGNLLGAEQSGFIADMGFETYQKILNESIAEMRNEGLITKNENEPERDDEYVYDCMIDTDIDASIPDDYIDITAEKIRIYRQLDNMKDEQEIKEFILEMTDRFGTIPQQFTSLINIVRLRQTAIKLGFEKIIIKNGIMLCYFVANNISPYYKSRTFGHILDYIQKSRRNYNIINKGGKLYIKCEEVNSIEKGVNILREMLPLPINMPS